MWGRNSWKYFQKGIPGLTLKRELECYIDMVPGVGPMTIEPYRMTSVELTKLKKQVEELLEKWLIWLNIFSWGFQCC